MPAAPATPRQPHPASSRPLVLGAVCGICFSVCYGAAFPPFGYGALGLLAPIALLFATRTAFPLRSAVGVTLGVLPVWAYHHRWVIDVSAAGYLPLCVYLALWQGAFVWVVARFRHRRPVTALWFAPLVWVGLEYLRAEIFFHGYPWYLLGQISRLSYPGGLFPLYTSGALAFVNGLFLYGAVASYARSRRGTRVLRAGYFVVALTMYFGACFFGVAKFGLYRSYHQHPVQAKDWFNIAAVQTNIPQSNKLAWSLDQRRADFSRMLALTRDAASLDPTPDLIVWPETMFPGVGLEDETLLAYEGLCWPDGQPIGSMRDELLGLQRSLGIPLLIGAEGIDGARLEFSDGHAVPRHGARYNSVFLIDHGSVQGRYDKMQLTPFGEVMPYVSAWPWLEQRVMALAAGGMRFNLDAGDAPTVFTVHNAAGEPFRIATPVCFEATDLRVLRKLTFDKDGARRADVLVQLTNDGWFGSVDASRRMHAQILARHAASLRTPVVRVSNTGTSCAIDDSGFTQPGPPARTQGVAAWRIWKLPLAPAGLDRDALVANTGLAALLIGLLLGVWPSKRSRAAEPIDAHPRLPVSQSS